MNLHVESEGAGRDLVLLHGWGLHSGAWAGVRPILARRFRVHCIDLPGHGRSAHVPAGDFTEAVDRVRDAMPDGALLCGWSLGGLVAQAIASTGKPLRGVALVATTPCFTRREDWPHAMAAATLEGFARGLRLDRERTLRDFVQLNALHGSHARASVRTLAALLAEHPASIEALEVTLGWLRTVDLRDAVPRIHAPAIVVHGNRDALAPVDAGRWLASRIPDARLVELEDAAHLPFLTHRDRFVAALESFVG